MNKFKSVISNILYANDEEEDEVEEVHLEEDPDLANATYLDEADSPRPVQKAADYLYSSDSAFLNAKPVEKKEEKHIDFAKEEEVKDYTPIQTISPVYGVVDSNNEPIVNNDESLKKYKSSTVKDSYLETVISPIFGYAANYYNPDDRYKTSSDDFASSIGAKNDYDNFKNDLKDIFADKPEDNATLDSLKELFNESKQDFDNKEDKVEDYDGLLSLFDDKKE